MRGIERMKNSKLQAPRLREIPSAKLQRSLRPGFAGRRLHASQSGGWILKFLWSLVVGVWCFSSSAYPPGPYTLLYGTVRDQYGTPLSLATSKVLLKTPSGQQYVVPISPGIGDVP